LARRIDIRNWVADSIDDLFEGTVAVPAVGTMSTTTLSDPKLIQLDSAYWKGADIVVEYIDGTFDERRVADYVPSLAGLDGGILRLDRALSKVPSTNTDYYLYRDHPVRSYNRAINSAIQNLVGRVEVRKVNEDLVATGGTFEYAVPTTAGIERLLDIYWLGSDNAPQRLDYNTWVPEREGGLLKFRLVSDSVLPAGSTIRIEGAGDPATLDRDDAVLEYEVPVEYVGDYAAGELKATNWSGVDPEDSARQATFYKQEAEQKLRQVRRFISRGRVIKRWQ
jgi:hypothetical protein